MKKRFSLLLCILFSFILFSPAAHAEEYFTEGLYRCRLENGQVTIVNTDKSIAGHVIVPAVLGGSPVTAIGEKAFFGRENITGIVVPEGVTEIGPFAFGGCINMKEVVLPEGFSVLPMGIFSGCGLTDLSFLSTVKVISEYAFEGCQSLADVHIPANVSRIENGAFQGATSIRHFSVSEENPHYTAIDGNLYTKDGKTILQYALGNPDSDFSFPGTTTSIAPRAFYWSGLKSVRIPSHIETIGFEAFYGCEALNHVILENGIASIGDKAFAKCESLTDIYIPGSVYSIGVEAFRECYTLRQARIEHGVQKIENSAFAECRALTDVSLPKTLTHIGDYTFSTCSALVSIRLPESLTILGSYAFFQCSSLETLTLPGSIVTVPKSLAEGSPKLHTVILGHGIEKIGDWAFGSCNVLRTVSIPNTVTAIGENAFERDWEIREVYFQGTQAEYAGIAVASGNELLENQYVQTVFLPQVYSADYADNTLTIKADPAAGLLQIKAYDEAYNLIYVVCVPRAEARDTYSLAASNAWSRISVRLVPQALTPAPAKTFSL